MGRRDEFPPSGGLKLRPVTWWAPMKRFPGTNPSPFPSSSGAATWRPFTPTAVLKLGSRTIFDSLELNLTLTPGDDFAQQVKDYVDGKSPFLRGTLSMLGQVSDQLTARPETTPRRASPQMTWSAGDHLVGREAFATLNDLKGKKIALQKSGPHVGMLNDILNTAKLKWSDIKVVWTRRT